MSEKGQVLETTGELAQIRLGRTDACSRCKKCAAGATKEFMIATVKNQCGAQKGDWVFVDVEQKAFATAALIMYGIPLISFFAGIFVGVLISNTIGAQSLKEPISFLTGVVFVITTYIIISLNEKRFRSKEYMPIATAISDDSEHSEVK